MAVVCSSSDVGTLRKPILVASFVRRTTISGTTIQTTVKIGNEPSRASVTGRRATRATAAQISNARTAGPLTVDPITLSNTMATVRPTTPHLGMRESWPSGLGRRSDKVALVALLPVTLALDGSF